jgi:hypothetical protein
MHPLSRPLAHSLAQRFRICRQIQRLCGGTRVASFRAMNFWINSRACLSFVGLIFAACSGTPTDSNQASGGSSNADAGGSTGAGASSITGGASAGTGGAGPISCGTNTCSAAQYCVIPCCGGTAPACFSVGDAGACPGGSHLGCSPPSSYTCSNPATCCQYDPCTPPAPYCSETIPVGCFTTGRTCQMMCA